MLRMYYGVEAEGGVVGGQSAGNPVDIDSVAFKPESFLEKLLKESRLGELYQQEEKMKKGRWQDPIPKHPCS